MHEVQNVSLCKKTLHLFKTYLTLFHGSRLLGIRFSKIVTVWPPCSTSPSLLKQLLARDVLITRGKQQWYFCTLAQPKWFLLLLLFQNQLYYLTGIKTAINGIKLIVNETKNNCKKHKNNCKKHNHNDNNFFIICTTFNANCISSSQQQHLSISNFPSLWNIDGPRNHYGYQPSNLFSVTRHNMADIKWQECIMRFIFLRLQLILGQINMFTW